MADAPIPSFDHVIEEGIALQRHLPSLDMVAVGGTAAALHAGHRYSTDVDHVTALLREQFDVVNDSLEMDRALPANLDGYADPAKLRGGGFRG